MNPQTGLRKLLVLGGSDLGAEAALEALAREYDIHHAADLEEALAAMRADSFEAVLAETSGFLPLERGTTSHRAAIVLDTLGDGVALIGPAGEIAWANPRLRQFPAPVREKLRELCVEAFERFALEPKTGVHARRFSMMPADGSYYEVICSPVLDGGGILRQVAAVVVDATHQRRQQLTLNAIERAGRELVGLDAASLQPGDVQRRLKLLEDRIIRCTSDVLHYEHFTILLLDPATNRLDFLVNIGMDEGLAKRELFATPEGNGIPGYVAATGHSYVCPDVGADPRYEPGVDGARSCLAVPLRMRDRIIGVLCVESHQPAAFGEAERQFAEMFAHHVAMALHMLNLLAAERHSTANQVSGSINTQVVGPLTDIITEASEMMEDYIGLDDVRHRLQGIIDQAVRARELVGTIAEEPARAMMHLGAAGVSEADAPLRGRRVLVADDEDFVRRIVRDLLASAGCTVDQAADGVEAIEKLQQTRYDLVVSDIKMPRAGGYEVFAAVQKLRPAVPVIFITGFGYDPDHSLLRARREGLAAILYKPFKVEDLMERCRDAIAGRK